MIEIKCHKYLLHCEAFTLKYIKIVSIIRDIIAK